MDGVAHHLGRKEEKEQKGGHSKKTARAVIELITYRSDGYRKTRGSSLWSYPSRKMISNAIGRDPNVHWNVHITSKARGVEEIIDRILNRISFPSGWPFNFSHSLWPF